MACVVCSQNIIVKHLKINNMKKDFKQVQNLKVDKAHSIKSTNANGKTVIRVFTAFSGYDSQMMALQRLQETCPDCKFILVGYCEIDKAACKVHDALFTGVKNYGDISKINWNDVEDFDLFTYSFCCQDISCDGAQKGFREGSGTRSSLLWECKKAISIKNPKWCLLENVKPLVQDKFYPLFIKWQRTLDNFGYTSTWKVVDASDFDVPQHRERTFMVSVRHEENGNSQSFYFPESLQPIRNVEDVLDSNVDKKYYLDNEEVAQFISMLNENNDDLVVPTSPAPSEQDILVMSVVTPTTANNKMPTLKASGFGKAHYTSYFSTGAHPKAGVLEVWESKVESSVNKSKALPLVSCPERCVKNSSKDFILSAVENLKPNQYLRIRSITPREALRYMGVSDADIDKMLNAGVSDAALYKQAGNSVVVDVMFYIFKNLLTLKE